MREKASYSQKSSLSVFQQRFFYCIAVPLLVVFDFLYGLVFEKKKERRI